METFLTIYKKIDLKQSKYNYIYIRKNVRE
jgi:hypothetical protein